jgi:hypothetical protein
MLAPIRFLMTLSKQVDGLIIGDLLTFLKMLSGLCSSSNPAVRKEQRLQNRGQNSTMNKMPGRVQESFVLSAIEMDILQKNVHMTKKANGDALNSREFVQKAYDARSAAKWARIKADKEKKKTSDEAGASQHFMGSIIEDDNEVPDFEQAILEEDDHDGQGCMQDTMIIDLRGKNHVYNQTGSHNSMKLFDVLFDSCSTCDVIVNGIFVTNIRKSKMTLVLRTQAGECRIDKVADFPGVGG